MLIGYDPYGGTMQHFDRGGIIAEVAAAGYDAINLPMRPDFMDVDDEGDLRTLQDMLASAGLKTPSVGVAPHTWATPGKEAATQECLDVAIRMAGRFGAQLLTMWPHLPPGIDKGDALAVLRRNMERAVPKADAAGYPIAFEFEKGCTIDNYREGIEFVKSTDGRIRVVADTYHIYNDGADPYVAAVALDGARDPLPNRELPPEGGDREESQPARAAPQLCDPPSGPGRGRASGPSAAWTQGRVENTALRP